MSDGRQPSGPPHPLPVGLDTRALQRSAEVAELTAECSEDFPGGRLHVAFWVGAQRHGATVGPGQPAGGTTVAGTVSKRLAVPVVVRCGFRQANHRDVSTEPAAPAPASWIANEAFVLAEMPAS